jgi:TonB-linked SusC/RagA family outer membrane protein
MKLAYTPKRSFHHGFLKALLLMKGTLLLILLTGFQLSARVFSQQTISLHLKNVEVKEVLQQIEKATTYRFLFSEAELSKLGKVDVDADNQEVTTILSRIFSTGNLRYRLVNDSLLVISNRQPFVADIQVTGRVTNVNGEPVLGVTVMVKGSTSGVSTNANGEYTLTVPDGATLLFTSIGYEDQEVAVAGRNIINIILQPSAKTLDQVVVVGYGTQRKRDLTGAIVSVKGSEIAKQPVLTATQAIQGKVAGVQIISSGAPNSAPIVRIRGTGSILGGVNPLYVVDGVLTDDIRNINSADILSLEVLKDASSAAIYGVRAANGVIIITTKKGRGGKMQVAYDANVGIREATRIVKMANANEYATYINEASVNTGNGDVLIDPSLTATNTDWFRTILRKAFQQNHNISLSGGNEKFNYFFSVGYISDEGIVIGNKFERFTLRSNNEYKLSNKVKISTLVSYSRGNTRDVNLGGAYNNAYHAAPVIPSKVNGRYGNTSAFQNVGNPVLDLEGNNNRYKENRIQGTGSLEYKPVSWLTLKTSYGVELGFNNRKIYAYQFLNDTNTFVVAGGNQVNNKSSLNISEERNSRWVWDNTATFQKSYGVHDISFLVGTTAEQIFNESNTSSRTDVPADPNLWYLNQGDPASQLNNSFADKRARNSYIARLNYGFDKRFLFTGTFRADGTSLFEDNWGNFPSFGVGWNIMNEKFMESQHIFSNLKLRASWGRLGNDNIPSTARFQTLQTGLAYYFNGTLISGSALLDVVDKNISWETTDETDIGIEFGIFNGKLTGELDFYNKKVKNALISVPIPGVLGDPNGLIITNVASIQNKGVELSLNWSDDGGKNLTYSISGNVSFNQNDVVGLNGGQPIFAGFVGTKGSTTLTTNNQPIGSFYVLQAEGVFHNQGELATYVTSSGAPITINGQVPTLGDLRYKDLDGNGKIDDNDRDFSGSYQPKVTYGLSGNVNYKSFDFSMALYGTMGSKIYNGKKAARFNSKDNVEASVANDRWTFTNFASNVPRASLNTLPQSTYFIESGNFLRINNLTVGYTFRQLNLTKVGISSLRCYLTGQNLFTFTKYSGFTPELAEGNPLNAGIEFNAYPTTRTYAFGVNLTF